MAFGVSTNRLSSFQPFPSQKWKILQNIDEICYVKHVLAPFYVFFHPICVLGGGGSQGV